MSRSPAMQAPAPVAVRPAFMAKVFYAFMAMALAAVAISIGGKWFGQSIAQGGHTDSTQMREIVINNNVIDAPDNAIRFAEARRGGIASRLDLYLRWPNLDGYSEQVRDDFNNADGARRIIFLTFEERSMSRDMSGRLAPIYSELIDKNGQPGPQGLTIYNFKPSSGYLDETLAVGQTGEAPFVARCLSGKAAEQSLAPCERDIQIGDNLSLSFRFPAELLAEWPTLEASVRAKAVSMLKTGS